MVDTALLNNLAASLKIEPIGSSQPAAGQPVRARIMPPLSDLQVTDLLAGTIDLTWVVKQVRFGDANLEPSLDPGSLNAKILGGMPIDTPLTPPPGVPGDLGQLRGSLPLSAATEVPVSAEVEWSVRDEQDQQELSAGTDFLAPAGLNGLEVAVVLAPPVAELTASPPPAPLRRHLHARVRLRAGGVQSDSIPLPAIPIFVPALALPTVLALFLHAEFEARSGDDDGAVLVLVPANSPFGSLGQLQPTLNQVQSAAGGLSGFAQFASFAAGLGELTGALAAQPYVQFRSNNQINNFDDITLIQRGFFLINTEAEDELSSIIFIGPSGRRAQLINARDTSTRDGAFTLTVGPNFITLVRSLHSATPVSEPEGMIDIDQAPPGFPGPSQFGDELSSFRFLSFP